MLENHHLLEEKTSGSQKSRVESAAHCIAYGGTAFAHMQRSHHSQHRKITFTEEKIRNKTTSHK